ncbi:plasmid partitioning protein RepB C-terminal domain-containing protein [Elioraea sp.]|uniref:plasmid partitioning protein RepB C-terminal domain-containing protein n=1 Tax=Elioraea sp. TaxID=2185103 RepID=UPI003F7037DD
MMRIPSHMQHIEMIPVDAIDVLNPRARNRRQHQEIVDSISAIGLKRPITVSRRETENEVRYDLICGEGRLEAFRMLGEAEVPAVVIDVSEPECLVMSLVENIARRQHRPIDLMNEIGSLAKRGYGEAEIAEKIGCSRSWVNQVVTLLERGEDRLVAAVETGLIPVAMATEIAQAESGEAQTILMEAYESGKIRGKKLGAVRRLLDRRLRAKRGGRDKGLGRRSHTARPTADDLLRVYQREANRQRLLARKADFAQARLLFIVEALRDLLGDDAFTTLLRAEALATMPRALAARIDGDTPR